jgi:hypothetical protein
LAGDDLKESAEKIAINSFMVDEFIAKEFRAGRIDRSLFVDTKSKYSAACPLSAEGCSIICQYN